MTIKYAIIPVFTSPSMLKAAIDCDTDYMSDRLIAAIAARPELDDEMQTALEFARACIVTGAYEESVTTRLARALLRANGEQ